MKIIKAEYDRYEDYDGHVVYKVIVSINGVGYTFERWDNNVDVMWIDPNGDEVYYFFADLLGKIWDDFGIEIEFVTEEEYDEFWNGE